MKDGIRYIGVLILTTWFSTDYVKVDAISAEFYIHLL